MRKVQMSVTNKIVLAMALAVVMLGVAAKLGPSLLCEWEDSTRCIWLAKHQGNGQGRSFIAISEDNIIYLPKGI